MKLVLTFKCPDAVSEAIAEAVSSGEIDNDQDKENAEAVCDKFIKHGEYVNIEIDTEKETARVLHA